MRPDEYQSRCPIVQLTLDRLSVWYFLCRPNPIETITVCMCRYANSIPLMLRMIQPINVQYITFFLCWVTICVSGFSAWHLEGTDSGLLFTNSCVCVFVWTRWITNPTYCLCLCVCMSMFLFPISMDTYLRKSCHFFPLFSALRLCSMVWLKSVERSNFQWMFPKSFASVFCVFVRTDPVPSYLHRSIFCMSSSSSYSVAASSLRCI